MLLHAQGKGPTHIGCLIKRSKSTVSRELKRHQLPQYSAHPAQKSYQHHRNPMCKAAKKLTNETYFKVVQQYFPEKNSPEQISGRLKLENAGISISPCIIYRAINAGMFDQDGRKASCKLRHRGKTRKGKTTMKNVAKFKSETH